MSAAAFIVGLAGALGGFVAGAVAMSAYHWQRRSPTETRLAQLELMVHRLQKRARPPAAPAPQPTPEIPVIEIRLDCSTCARSEEPVTPNSPCKTCFDAEGRATQHTPKDNNK